MGGRILTAEKKITGEILCISISFYMVYIEDSIR
jgi:hypothetical protein